MGAFFDVTGEYQEFLFGAHHLDQAELLERTVESEKRALFNGEEPAIFRVERCERLTYPVHLRPRGRFAIRLDIPGHDSLTPPNRNGDKLV